MILNCESCGAEIALDPNVRSTTCLYCASPNVIERPPQEDRPRPNFVIGFGIHNHKALTIAKDWQKGLSFFVQPAFRRAAIEQIKGLYLPTYLYSAEVHADYTASIGENYIKTTTYTTTDSQGKTVTRTKSETVTEWRSLAGSWASYVYDLVVTASKGIPNAELEKVEPFDLSELLRYCPQVISGWPAEEPTLKPAECLALGRDETKSYVDRKLKKFLPGDKHRALKFQPEFRQEDLALVLLPIWVLPVRYRSDRPVVRLLVNGQTGRLAGRAPLSWQRMLLAFTAGIVVLGGAVLAYLFYTGEL